MSELSRIAVVKELLDSASRSITDARMILKDLVGDTEGVSLEGYAKQASSMARSIPSEGGKVLNGVFNGESMVDPEGSIYPVPANYASKSKLVSGDSLKLTITDEGRFLYKQIGPGPRKHVVGPLSYEDGQYKVLTEGKAYRVLLASVTYFKAEIGDEITIIVPDGIDSEWAAIDAVLPKFQNVVV